MQPIVIFATINLEGNERRGRFGAARDGEASQPDAS
jgi:hypothetical protein